MSDPIKVGKKNDNKLTLAEAAFFGIRKVVETQRTDYDSKTWFFRFSLRHLAIFHLINHIVLQKSLKITFLKRWTREEAIASVFKNLLNFSCFTF